MKAPGSIYGFLIMVVIASSVFFQDVYSQSPILDREIQIHEQTATVKNLLNEISISGGFSFSYGKDVPLNKRVRISSAKQSIRHHLEQIFKGDSLEFVEKGNKVLIIPVSPEPPKDIPKQTIRGKIRDLDSKIPLIGVNVVLGSEGPLKGTITDENGYFRFEGVFPLEGMI